MGKWKSVVGTLMFTVAVGIGSVVVGTRDVSAKDEDWTAPTFAYGWTLTDSEKKQVEEDLGIIDKNGKTLIEVNEFPVEGKDLVKYVPDKGFDDNSKAWSSALIIPLKKGSGVGVKIVTPDKITSYTESQYRQASLDSGIFDAEIRVASPKILDGSGAFSGIRKAYDEEVPPADKEEEKERQANYEMSQKNMEDMEKLSTDNKENPNYDEDKVLLAIADVKKEVAEMVQKQGDLATKEDIQKMLDEALKKNGQELSSEQVNNLVVPQIERFMGAPVAKNTETVEALDNFKTQVENGLNDLADKFSKEDFANGAEKAKEKTKSFFEKVKSWWNSLWDKTDNESELTNESK